MPNVRVEHVLPSVVINHVLVRLLGGLAAALGVVGVVDLSVRGNERLRDRRLPGRVRHENGSGRRTAEARVVRRGRRQGVQRVEDVRSVLFRVVVVIGPDAGAGAAHGAHQPANTGYDVVGAPLRAKQPNLSWGRHTLRARPLWQRKNGSVEEEWRWW